MLYFMLVCQKLGGGGQASAFGVVFAAAADGWRGLADARLG
jgi:hypothetical protein